MKKIKLSEYARQNAMAYRTAIRHYHDGLIPGEQHPVTGTILAYVEDEPVRVSSGVALYARVSSSQNKSNLDNQQKRLEDYAAAKGYVIAKNVKEIGSGLNDQRPKLLGLLKDDSWNVLIVEHKDRLTRFGFAYLETLLAQQGKSIEVINTSEDKDDLMEDFVSVITNFAARIYGRRRTRRETEKIIKELSA